MHEGSITSSIIETVLDTLQSEGLDGPVEAVHIIVGVCQGLVPDSMKMFFDMEKPGTQLENAELVVTVQGIVARCADCGRDHELDVAVMYCPDCGTPMDMVKGDEILITEIEVLDND